MQSALWMLKWKYSKSKMKSVLKKRHIIYYHNIYNSISKTMECSKNGYYEPSKWQQTLEKPKRTHNGIINLILCDNKKPDGFHLDTIEVRYPLGVCPFLTGKYVCVLERCRALAWTCARMSRLWCISSDCNRNIYFLYVIAIAYEHWVLIGLFAIKANECNEWTG